MEFEYLSYEERRLRREESISHSDTGIISAELKALKEIFGLPTQEELREIGDTPEYCDYVNRAGGITRLFCGAADIYDAQGQLIATVYKASDEDDMDTEYPQGTILGPEDIIDLKGNKHEYRDTHHITDLNDNSIETIMEMLAPAEDRI